ncbi:MAG: hypothetical protein A2275_10195 [Bacteroidetes bacterium RIFOXYA12_FULL_35_11]|nr:MAG: hypothetical protein A2X01_14115 [Bacteroidetes bacterium GWF2_35_48]OFY76773.1 MAG: hypothetical protein A2275_10195 [Bacteroidetes bacterium RIFOXYA12_FULL_35_11]OFZ02275.1 MAG: hypothetical protein A2491_12600 [Bacteroidetes bacterium RIFOXYC12_FULL_35_7]HBX52281.1 hypothetical protein [Bacteroidales bacterium]
MISPGVFSNVSDAIYCFNNPSKDTIRASNDSVIYDTVYVKKEPVYVSKEIKVDDPASIVYLSLGFYASPLFSANNYSVKSETYELYKLKLRDAVSERTGFTLGAYALFFNRKFRTEIGFAITRINDDFFYTAKQTLIDSSLTIITDTLDVYYIVSGTDTSAVYITENRQFTLIDTLQKKYEYEQKNTITNFEIPVLFGYELNYKKFAITPKIGAIPGFVIQKNGLIIDVNDTLQTSPIQTYLSNFSFSILASFNFSYDVNTRLRIFAEPFYRKWLLNTFSNSFILKNRPSAFGIKTGVVYNF